MSPAVPLFALACAGALIGLHLDAGPLPFVVVAALSALLAWRAHRKVPRAAAVLAFTLATTSALAAWHRARHDAVVDALPHGRVVVVEGVVRDVVPARASGARLALDVEHIVGEGKCAAALQVRVDGGAAGVDVKAGDRVRVRGRVKRLAPADSPGEFDAARFGLARGVHGGMAAYDAAALAVVDEGAKSAWLSSRRAALRARVLELVTPREAGVLLALLIGDTSLFDDEQLALYRRVGAGHLLAVSGLQVTLIALVLQWLLFACAVRAGPVARRGWARRLSCAFALAGVWAYVGLCGAPPSAVRAAGMASAAMLALFLGRRRAAGADALALAGLVTVVVSPTSVIDPSFLLSYAAVLGLVLAHRPGASRLRSTLLACFGAGALTLPVSAHLFGAVAPGGLVANVVLVPVASVVQAPALALGFLSAWLRSSTMAELAAACAGAIEALCAGLDGPLGGLVALTAPGGLTTLGLTFGAALLVAGVARGPRRPLLLASALVLAACMAPDALPVRELRVTALPVGQGDGLVVELPGGEVMLVDGGGRHDERWDPGERVVLPYLARRGIERVDVVVLSHPHPDHLLGLLSVVEQLEVKELWHGGYGEDHPLMGRLLDVARRRGVRVRAARELLGGERPFGGAFVRVLAPAPGGGEGYYDELAENDNSVVVRLRYGADSVLLTGDIEEWGESYLLATAGEALASTVVKAPHHGSRTSSSPALVGAVKAEHVLFTTGRDNQWGFPHDDVVARWRAAGATPWDTARHGEVTFRLSGRGVTVDAFRGARAASP